MRTCDQMRTSQLLKFCFAGGAVVGLFVACSDGATDDATSDTSKTGDSGTVQDSSTSTETDSAVSTDDSGVETDSSTVDGSSPSDSGVVDSGVVDSGVVDSGVMKYQVGGSVTGLSGTVVLQNNGGDNLTINADGAFHFTTTHPAGTAYLATVLTNPASPTKQQCTVTNGSGNVGAADVTSITVTCVSTPTVGGAVSGLVGAGLVLKNNGGDDLPVAANGAFTFTTPLAAAGAYAVTVGTQPADQWCDVSAGTGNVSTNVSDVVVTCYNLVCGTGDENTSVSVACPGGGTIAGLQFASYGTPTGSCGTYATSMCNSATSTSVVTTACVGNAGCTVPATNGNFGDPCGGTFKHLYIAAKCTVP